MAVSKNTCTSDTDTNQLFQNFFDNSQVSEDREQEWREAVRYAGSGTPPLRFPVYEKLYQLNVSAQRMIELLEQLAEKFSIGSETCLYHRSLIQYVRSDVSRDLLEAMDSVEMTESWLFESLRRAEEKRLFGPDEGFSNSEAEQP